MQANFVRYVCLFALLATSQIAVGQEEANNWLQFRGPNGNGVVKDLSHPTTWSGDENLAWTVDVPGGGWSSPIVIGEKIYLTTAAGPMKPVGFMEGVRNMRPTKPESPLKFQVICLNLVDGSEIWTKTYDEKIPEHGIHPSNSFATETPVSDGTNLYVSFASIGLVLAIDGDGNEIWRKNVGAYATGNGFGTGSSMAMHEDLVFVQCDNDESSFVVAFNKADGKEAWRKERKGTTSWATPLVWENENRVELITCGAGFVTSYNPADGSEYWTITGIDAAFSASPAADSKRVYFGNSGPMSSGPLLAVGCNMSGEHKFSPDTEFGDLAWSKMQAGPGMPSPVSTEGQLYITGRRTISCYNTEDGTEVFRKSRVDGLQSAAASLWTNGKQLFILDETGQTFVFEVGSELKLLGVNRIDDLFWSTPSVAGESLLMRGVSKLYCIRDKK